MTSLSTPAQEPQGEKWQQLYAIAKSHHEIRMEAPLLVELLHDLRAAIEERDKALNALRDVDRCLEKVIKSSIRLTVRAEINAARYAIRAALSKPAGPQEEKP
jgi:hypothetical protein